MPGRAARHLRPPPFEALGRAMLVQSRKTPDVFDQRPGSHLGSREVGLAHRWGNPARRLLSYGGKSEGIDYSQD
jgi:hypothetical protein